MIRECLDSFVAGFIQLHRAFEILYRLFEKINEVDALRAVVLRDGLLQVRETADPAGPTARPAWWFIRTEKSHDRTR